MNYLYNGMEFPECPKTAYTHEYIATGSYWSGADSIVYFATNSTYEVSSNGVVIAFGIGEHYLLTDGEWVLSGKTNDTATIVWTNTDTYNEDGTLYLAASDPIPVNPTDPTSLLQGWLVGRRIAGQRGKATPETN